MRIAAIAVALAAGVAFASSPPFARAAVLEPLDRVERISSGYEHTCGVRTGGNVVCWGQGLDGQLGNDASGHVRFAVPTSAIGGAVRDVAAGDAHTCAVRLDGAVACWGSNDHFQLGTTAVPITFEPRIVANVSTAQSVAAGDEHTCIVTAAGAVRCWGGNFFGQLGNGSSQNDNPNPGTVSGLSSGANAVAAGQDHTCALASGRVSCWGAGLLGRLGDGTENDRSQPVTAIASGATAIATGRAHSCALMTGGTVQCWGDNGSGQLGDGTRTQRLAAVPVVGLGGTAIAIGAGFSQTCVVLTGGAVRCWGAAALGDGTQNASDVPVTVTGLGPAVAISPGGGQACALLQDESVACWGSNQYGQIGNDVPIVRTRPVDVLGLPAAEATAIAVGEHFSCAIVAGATYCWGQNTDGRLGNGTTSDIEPAPVAVVGFGAGTRALALRDASACALDGAGGARCWGANDAGQLGDGTTDPRSAPVGVVGLASGLARIGLGRDHGCALSEAGRVSCWGNDTFGQHGDGAAAAPLTPTTPIGFESGTTALGVGGFHACAANASQTRCWGSGGAGQLGNGFEFAALVNPGLVTGLPQPAQQLELGVDNSCAIGPGGALHCWGANTFGKLGDGSTESERTTPVAVVGRSSGTLQMNPGLSTSCALVAGGLMQCWGRDDFGLFGDGSPQSSYRTPVAFTALGPNVRAIAPGDHFHSCAIVANGGVRCWGDNFWGQLGDGTSSQRLSPAAVLVDATLFADGFED